MENKNGIDLLGLSQPLTKLVETVSAGVGRWYEPRQVVRMAKAEAKAIQIVSDAVNKYLNLPIKYETENISIDTTNTEALLQRTQQRFVFQEMLKQQNIEDVVAHAYKQLEKKDTASIEPVDNDWVSVFFDCVANVSDERMQALWGKILAGEVVQPNSFSKRTLDIVRKLAQTEAETFEKILPLVFQSGTNLFVPADSKQLNSYNINYSDIMLLDECGLIVKDGFLSINIIISEKDPAIVHNGIIVAIISTKTNEKTEISIGTYSLTQAGKELYRILEHRSNDDAFYGMMDKLFDNHKNSISIKIHKITNILNSVISYNDEVLKEY